MATSWCFFFSFNLANGVGTQVRTRIYTERQLTQMEKKHAHEGRKPTQVGRKACTRRVRTVTPYHLGMEPFSHSFILINKNDLM